MRNTIVAGHGLQAEGKPYELVPVRAMAEVEAAGRYFRRRPGTAGLGLCRCGATSGVLVSDAARKRWHTGHKTHVREGIGSKENRP